MPLLKDQDVKQYTYQHFDDNKARVRNNSV